MRLLIALFAASACAMAFGQELVVNGSFEDHRLCPELPGPKTFKGVAGVGPVVGTPLYFNACSAALGTPTNWCGHQAPKDGDAYVGMILTSRLGDRTDRHFVRLDLSGPLENGHRYRLTFWVSAAEGSGYITDRIGAGFGDPSSTKKKGVSQWIGHPDVDNPLDAFLSDTAGWTAVQGIYHARGGEDHLVIGNFQPYGFSTRKALTPNSKNSVLENTKRKNAILLEPDKRKSGFLRSLSQAAYVYVDAVSLVPLENNSELSILTQEMACTLGEQMEPGEELVPDVRFDQQEARMDLHWRNAGGGTPDLLEGRTGIYLYSAVNPNNREFIRTPLLGPTDTCSMYRFSMRIQREASYGFAVDRIGFALVHDVKKDQFRGPLPYPPSWISPEGAVMENDGRWITFCAEVQGRACATDMIVGNFMPDSATTVRSVNTKGGPFAYYFVDDISLQRVGTIDGCAYVCDPVKAQDEVMNEPPTTGMRILLPIHFGTASDVADTLDRAILDRLRTVLLEDPDAVIRIEGHTDDQGNDQVNDRLSLERARAIRRSLVDQGIPIGNLELHHFGSRRPVGDNTTEAGRASNRRVELVLP